MVRVMRIALRYDMRAPDIGAPAGDLYRTAVEQCAWADRIGIDSVYLAEHHGAEDGYCPAPIVLAGAIAGCTRRIEIHFSALVVTLHDPVRLAEDLAILDLLTGGGRVAVTAGMGYRPHEFAMFGIDPGARVSRLEDAVRIMREAWSGEPFEYRGTTMQLRPAPATPGGPTVYIGGSVEAAARRAARMGLGFRPATAQLYDVYREERLRLGLGEPEPLALHGPSFLYVSDDPERDWELVAPHLAHTTNSYARWARERGAGATKWHEAATIDDLKESDAFHVVTPQQCVELARRYGPDGELRLHPLLGGLDPELSWRSLHLFERAVIPRLEAQALRPARGGPPVP